MFKNSSSIFLFISLVINLVTSQYNAEDVKSRMTRTIVKNEKAIGEEKRLTTFKRFDRDDLQHYSYRQPIKSKRSAIFDIDQKHAEEESGMGARQFDTSSCFHVYQPKTSTICISDNHCFDIVFTEVHLHCQVV